MIRQAHTYLAGAVSGTALVAAAVVAFVLLVSFQALKDWPLAGINIGGGDSTVSSPNSGDAAAPTAGAGSAGSAVAGGPASTGNPTRDANRAAAARGDSTALATAPQPAAGAPSTEVPAPTAPAADGPSASSPPGSASASSNSGNGGGANPGAGLGGAAGGSGQSTSGAITNTVNKTVSGVDEATGGVIGSTGVTGVTEKAVEEAAGPESTVGKTVDEVVKTVGGLLGGNR